MCLPVFHRVGWAGLWRQSEAAGAGLGAAAVVGQGQPGWLDGAVAICVVAAVGRDAVRAPPAVAGPQMPMFGRVLSGRAAEPAVAGDGLLVLGGECGRPAGHLPFRDRRQVSHHE